MNKTFLSGLLALQCLTLIGTATARGASLACGEAFRGTSKVELSDFGTAEVRARMENQLRESLSTLSQRIAEVEKELSPEGAAMRRGKDPRWLAKWGIRSASSNPYTGSLERKLSRRVELHEAMTKFAERVVTSEELKLYVEHPMTKTNQETLGALIGRLDGLLKGALDTLGDRSFKVIELGQFQRPVAADHLKGYILEAISLRAQFRRFSEDVVAGYDSEVLVHKRVAGSPQDAAASGYKYEKFRKSGDATTESNSAPLSGNLLDAQQFVQTGSWINLDSNPMTPF